jgi:pimeloyl-ACP methyl ester carboxylesterase
MTEVSGEACRGRGPAHRYKRADEGPLVLSHRFVGDARSTWRRQIADFSDEFTVVAWDVPSAGRSSDPPASFTLPDSTLVLEFPTAAELGKLRRQPFIGMPGCLAG